MTTHNFRLQTIFILIYSFFSLIQSDTETRQILNPFHFTPISQRRSDVGYKTYHQVLDPGIGLSLTWAVKRDLGKISMVIESQQRRGDVVIGFTKGGLIQGADVLVAGIQGDGTPFVLDMYGVDNTTIGYDAQQDWKMVPCKGATIKSRRRIYVCVERDLETCDALHDFPIREDKFEIAYASRRNSAVSKRFVPDGIEQIYFINPSFLPKSLDFGLEKLETWTLTRKYEIPARSTSYWCTMHRVSIPTRRHIIAFDEYFGDEEARRRIHHQILYRCHPPKGVDPDTFFSQYLNHPGEECYVNKIPIYPKLYCHQIVQNYAIGAKMTKIPDPIGISIGGGQSDYFMLEAHYDNPELEAGIVVEHGGIMYHTDELREEEGSMFFVGHGILGTFVIPPSTSDFRATGHCSRECLTQLLPVEGADISFVLLHAHLSTRKMRLRHFRGDTELPWIINSEEYDVQYQQHRHLDEPRRVMPGDQLTVECTYDTNWKNGSAAASGFSTRDEMCLAFMLINKPAPYLYCSSEYKTERTMERYGILNMTWDEFLHERVINSALDPRIVGRTLSQVVESQVWTPEAVQRLQDEQSLSEHNANCPNLRTIGNVFNFVNGVLNRTTFETPIIDRVMGQSETKSTTLHSPWPEVVRVRYPQNMVPYVPPVRCPLEREKFGKRG